MKNIMSIFLFVFCISCDNDDFDVILFDAGTDSGSDYTSLDEDINPKEVVKLLKEAPLGNGTTVSPSVGKLIITKQ